VSQFVAWVRLVKSNSFVRSLASLRQEANKKSKALVAMARRAGGQRTLPARHSGFDLRISFGRRISVLGFSTGAFAFMAGATRRPLFNSPRDEFHGRNHAKTGAGCRANPYQRTDEKHAPAAGRRAFGWAHLKFWVTSELPRERRVGGPGLQACASKWAYCRPRAPTRRPRSTCGRPKLRFGHSVECFTLPFTSIAAKYPLSQ
jgi:hypothetical protein